MGILALGSVVILRGTAKKLMVVSRAVGVKHQGKIKEFEYAGCSYPEGVTSEELIFFNIDDVGKVVFEGYKDDTSLILEESIKEWTKDKKITEGE